ncbi:hypothetical protein Cpin_6117 [Chitinophaga pinensis DSM 2588]|uniref:Uncharacterized protein n=1 Tax=Chitinophaga pinensis (strain ATCC 43595 / DSM 2588 / LMG 13176 / NBRC 15968 / NCIMB 11800 / UQM 2034) TaxID=485918 RepID=A0A979G9Z0_CHIPD|nr:hypothetical protein Cpin_6117 [Chitinophaga pinensis DSM 2588]
MYIIIAYFQMFILIFAAELCLLSFGVAHITVSGI